MISITQDCIVAVACKDCNTRCVIALTNEYIVCIAQEFLFESRIAVLWTVIAVSRGSVTPVAKHSNFFEDPGQIVSKLDSV